MIIGYGTLIHEKKIAKKLLKYVTSKIIHPGNKKKKKRKKPTT